MKLRNKLPLSAARGKLGKACESSHLATRCSKKATVWAIKKWLGAFSARTTDTRTLEYCLLLILLRDPQRLQQFHEMGAVQAQSFGRMGPVALGGGESADEELTSITIDGIVE